MEAFHLDNIISTFTYILAELKIKWEFSYVLLGLFSQCAP